MKKILFSALALCFAMAINADVETGSVTEVTLSSTAQYLANGTALHNGTNVTWTVGGDNYKIGGSGTFTINNSSVAFNDGPIGSVNPSYCYYADDGSKLQKYDESGDSITSVGASSVEVPDTGAFYKFAVKESGYLYIFGKFDPTKHYVAWEGNNRIPYTFVAYDENVDGNVITCDLNTLAASSIENGCLSTSYSIETLQTYITNAGYTSASSDNHTGAYVRIAVTAGETYTFCGTGTKVTLYGYCFAPVDEVVTIAYSNTTLVSETVQAANGDVTAATWDWLNAIPKSIENIGEINGETTYVDSNIDGIQMYVDATNGKLKANGSNAQFNSGTILRVPVVSEGDEVEVYCYKASDTTYYTEYTVGGGDVINSLTDENPYTYTATDIDANRNGYVEIVCTNDNSGKSYLWSVKVKYATAIAADEISEKISSDLSEPKDATYGSDEEEEEEGVTKVTVNGDPVSFESTSTVYYSVTIPEDAGTGTLTISCTDADLETSLYFDAECGNKAADCDANSYTYTWSDDLSSWVTSYSYTGLTPGTKYYGYIPKGILASEVSGTIYATYVSSDESETIDYNIKLVSSTDVTDGLTKLAEDEFTITISAENLEDGNVIMLDVYSDDSNEDNQHFITMQYFTADTSNEGYYTWTAPIDYALTEGLTYTFYATPYSSEHQGTALSEAVKVLEVVGAEDTTPKVKLTAISPDPSTTETLTTNQIALTFSDKVTITEAYVLSYTADQGSSHVDVTPENENNATSTTWTITVPESTMETLTSETADDEEVNFEMIVYAKDENGNDVYDMDGELTYIEIEYDKVSYTTTGINGITLQAGSDDLFYNLNGQRVATPHNGVFILNGKKVLVK